MNTATVQQNLYLIQVTQQNVSAQNVYVIYVTKPNTALMLALIHHGTFERDANTKYKAIKHY